MSEAWRARDEQLHRNIALKILLPEFARDPSHRARFEQEARALAALNHPNLVAVYEFGEENGQVYLISELVEGESLSVADSFRASTRTGVIDVHALMKSAQYMPTLGPVSGRS